MVVAKESKRFLKLSTWLLFLLFVIFPFGQLSRLEIGQGITLHLLDIIVGLISIHWIIWQVRLRRPFPKYSRLLINFLCLAALSLLINLTFVTNREFLVGSFYLFRLALYICFYISVSTYLAQFKSKDFVWLSLLIIGGYTAIFGWLQYLLYPDTRSLREFGWDDHYYRLVGTFLDPGFTGILLVLFTLTIFSRKWGRGEEKIKWVLGIFGIVTTAFTYSRASYLALIIGLIALYIVRRKLKELSFTLLLFTTVIILLPNPGGEGVRLSRTSTINLRLENYRQTISLVKTNPIFGVGYNLLKFQKKDIFSHSSSGEDSSVLFVLATTGIGGLLIYLHFWGKILSDFWRQKNSETGVLLISSSVALLTHSLFVNSLFYPWVLIWFFLILALHVTTQNK